MGKLKGSFTELFQHGCIQTGGDDSTITLNEAGKRHGRLFALLMGVTNHDPCEKCIITQKECHAWQRFHEDARELRRKEIARRNKAKNATKAPGTDKYPGLSIAKIASKLNISKSEVRRRKAAGEL